MKIRLSYGTAVKMGLRKGAMLAEPTTAYVMLGEHCDSNCAFCAQRKSKVKKDYLSRILWISYPPSVLKHLKNFSRVCFQTLDYSEVVDDIIKILPVLPKIPVSVSIVPVSRNSMLRLHDAGVRILSIAIDAANPNLFTHVKGSGVGNRFTWNDHWDALKEATKIFSGVNTHLIVGMGESDADLINIMFRLNEINVTTALFSYTPVHGGTQPDAGRYRAIQLARYLIYSGYDDFYTLNGEKIVELKIPEREKNNVNLGVPFLTSGCPGCNRPFYNERPGGTIYNYPHKMNIKEQNIAMSQLRNYASVLL